MSDSRLFHIVSLGCPKARVDTEYVLADLFEAGLQYTDDPGEADYVLVNTCAFIDPAKEESIDTLLEMRAVMKEGARLVAIGCLAERYGAQLLGDMHEVDAWVGVSQLPKVLEALDRQGVWATGDGSWVPEGFHPRVPSLSENWAYLKIAEGCNRSCAFCAIPGIRGMQRSIPVDLLVEEAAHLVDMGAMELTLVAQDLTTYGSDIGTDLVTLVRELARVQGLEWIRLLYLYPGPRVVELVKRLLDVDRVVPYVDIPIQHVDTGVLRAMKRGYNEEIVRSNVEALRSISNDLVLRTTVLVGHPGEDEAAFGSLLDFVREGHFDHLGAFAYSPEEGTAAYPMEAPDPEEAESRRQAIEEAQSQVARKRYEGLVGRTVRALVDGFDPESMAVYGRFHGQAPEIDGDTYFTDMDASPGTMVTARIVDVAYPDVVVGPLTST